MIFGHKENKKEMCSIPQAIGFSNLHDSFVNVCLNVLFSALLHKILVENPSVRITIPDIKKDRWYNKLLKKGSILKIQVFLFCEIRHLTRVQTFWNNHCGERERKLLRETQDWQSVEDPVEDSNRELIVASFSV